MFDLNIPKQIATGGESAGLDQSAFTVEKRGWGGDTHKGHKLEVYCSKYVCCKRKEETRLLQCVCVCVREGQKCAHNCVCLCG